MKLFTKPSVLLRVAFLPLLALGVVLTTIALRGPVSRAFAQAGPSISIESTPDIPAQMFDVRVAQGPMQAAHLECKLTNLSPERLLALEITWRFSFSNGKTVWTHTRLDYVFDDALRFSAGTTETALTALPMLKTPSSPIPDLSPTNVTAKTTFAEFANGTLLGIGRDPMAQWLAGERNSRMAEYRQLLKVMRSGGEAGLHQALGNEVGGVTEHGAEVRHELGQLEQSKGIEAVQETLKRRSETKIPE